MSNRGFITWKPRGETRERIDMTKAILAEYSDFLPLTLRQVFYRAVGQYGYDKTEAAYKRLGYTLAKARRAEMIDMGAIRDDGITKQLAPGYDSLTELEWHIREIGKHYRRQAQLGQSRRILLVCEAAGMVPQLARIANELGVDVRSSGGYDSVTAKYRLARDLLDMERFVTVLHIGDLDPSGEDMFTVISEDVGAFFRQLNLNEEGGKSGTEHRRAEFVRIAVTRGQATQHELPTAPKKETDTRAKKFAGETVQCEALPPDTLNRIVRDEIEARMDMQAFAANQAREAEDKKAINEVLSRLTFGATSA